MGITEKHSESQNILLALALQFITKSHACNLIGRLSLSAL